MTNSKPIVVLSPHLDDAVFSCGRLLATRPGSVVITAFAGLPVSYDMSTAWDAHCGFSGADDAVLARREEDRQALAVLQARPIWLDFADGQYEEIPSRDRLHECLARAVEELEPEVMVAPLGLFHRDHLLVHAAALQIAARLVDCEFVAYEDAPYRSLPGLVQQRLAALHGEGIVVTPSPLAHDGGAALKAHAVSLYASQWNGLNTEFKDDMLQPERLWQLDLGSPQASSVGR